MEKRIYLLAVMLLVVGGCGGERIPEPPPPTDGANVTAGAANVVRPAASVSVPVDAGGQEAGATPPIAGPVRGVVVDETGTVPAHGPDSVPPPEFGPDAPQPPAFGEGELAPDGLPWDEHGPEGPSGGRSGVVLPGGL